MIEETTAGKVARGVIYAFIYGEEGVGKTRLPLTLSRLEGNEFGLDVGYVTAEPTGATTVASINPDIRVLRVSGEDQILDVARAVKKLAKSDRIRAICVDGLHVLCGNTIDQLSDGEGEKALGFEGWQTVLTQFRRLERACNAVVAGGKSVILTALELQPQYEQGAFSNEKELVERGRPYLQGKAKNWMPAQCDIVARMTSVMQTTTVMVDGRKRAKKHWQGMLHLDRSTPYVCKTRWRMPSPYPADLRQLLRDVRKQKKNLGTTSIKLKK